MPFSIYFLCFAWTNSYNLDPVYPSQVSVTKNMGMICNPIGLIYLNLSWYQHIPEIRLQHHKLFPNLMGWSPREIWQWSWDHPATKEDGTTSKAQHKTKICKILIYIWWHQHIFIFELPIGYWRAKSSIS